MQRLNNSTNMKRERRKGGSYWNYRIMAHEYKGEIYFKMHEVYYTALGLPDGYTKDAVDIQKASIQDISRALSQMQRALKEPVIWAGKKFPRTFKQ